MSIQHRSNSILHALDRFRQLLMELLHSASVPSPDVVSCGRLCNACIIRGRDEGDVEFFVSCFGAKAIWVDELEGVFGCVPA